MTPDYVYSLTQAQLDEIVPYELPQHDIKASHKCGELLLHVANHATDHRAQILAMLNQEFGATTCEQDLLFYLLDKR